MRAALWMVALAATWAAFPASAQLGADAKRTYEDFQRLGPHRVFMLAPDGKTDALANAPGADPAGAVDGALKRWAPSQLEMREGYF